MRVLNQTEVEQVNGGFWGYAASAFGGFVLSETFFSPIKEAVYKHMEKEHKKLKDEFKSNPDKFIKENTSFYGD